MATERECKRSLWLIDERCSANRLGLGRRDRCTRNNATQTCAHTQSRGMRTHSNSNPYIASIISRFPLVWGTENWKTSNLGSRLRHIHYQQRYGLSGTQRGDELPWATWHNFPYLPRTNKLTTDTTAVTVADVVLMSPHTYRACPCDSQLVSPPAESTTTAGQEIGHHFSDTVGLDLHYRICATGLDSF